MPPPDNPHFGVRLDLCQSSKLPGYDEAIQNVLIYLISKIEEFEGYRMKGVFCNGNPTNSELEMGRWHEGVVNKEALDEFQLILEYESTGEYDLSTRKRYYVYMFTELIKVWFEELPESILDCLEPKVFESAGYKARVGAAITRMQEPNQTVFVFLLDICNQVCEHANENLMPEKRLAAVWAQKVYGLHNKDVKLSAIVPKIENWFVTAMKWRKSEMVKVSAKKKRRGSRGGGTPRRGSTPKTRGRVSPRRGSGSTPRSRGRGRGRGRGHARSRSRGSRGGTPKSRGRGRGSPHNRGSRSPSHSRSRSRSQSHSKN